MVRRYRPVLIPCATVTSGQLAALNNKRPVQDLAPQPHLLELSLRATCSPTLAFHSPHHYRTHSPGFNICFTFFIPGATLSD
jgi:hypothetical protein